MALKLMTASGYKNGFAVFELELLSHFPGRFEIAGKIRSVNEFEPTINAIQPDIVTTSTQFIDG